MSRTILALSLISLAAVASAAPPATGPASDPWAGKQAMIEKDRQAAIGAEAKASIRRNGPILQIMNTHIVLTIDESTGQWDATWLKPVEAAVHGAGFSPPRGVPQMPANSPPDRFTDQLGSGMQLRQVWGNGSVERILRVYDDRPVVTISGKITHAAREEIALDTVKLLDISPARGGWWQVGQTHKSPAAVYINGASALMCEPAAAGDAERAYTGTGVLCLANRDPSAAIVLGFLTAREARPDLAARFKPGQGGGQITAELRFLGRKLRPGESIQLDAVYLSAHQDPYTALGQYGDAAAAFVGQPIRKGPNSLWCSWYAHRMAMTEDLVLANAAVIARHFQPLGMDTVQLDHGWQRGDVTGDWVPNERFPHGLKWLARELKSRHGLKLGLWIAPTDVAATSELFNTHPDWMLRDDAGRPKVNWKWYWKPNPDCYELDATHPDAARWIEDTFARLSAEGVSYFKIDFIAASGGEQFRQYNPYATRGWSNLRSAMEAIRRGAGPDAWIRYCQPPPLLAAGLANSAHGGDDTLDAGIPGRFDVLSINARHLAAGYWLDDRLYHREVCDMSVRMPAGLEEVRLRLAMMTLAGCSIAFSDEFQYLPASRIRMMQQCLPPGCPPMRPLDLVDRPIPSVWHIHCRNEADEWDVVGLFNFEATPQERAVDFASLGLPPDVPVAAFEFWEERFAGIHQKELALMLPPQSSRVLALRRLTGRPQLIGTDMHILQGFREICRLSWDPAARRLTGRYRRMPGVAGKAFMYLPPGWQPHFDFPLRDSSARLTHLDGSLWMQEIDFRQAECDWSIPFDQQEAR